MFKQSVYLVGWLHLVTGAIACSDQSAASGAPNASAPCTTTACTAGTSSATAPSARENGSSIAAAGASAPVAPESAGRAAPSSPSLGAMGVTGGAAAPASGSVSGPSSSDSSGVPCDVAPIVSAHCSMCHAKQPQFGAPMALTTAADFRMPARTVPTKTVREVAVDRINATDSAQLMPPPTSTKLSADNLQVFNQWLRGGALDASQSCPITAPSATSAGGDTGTLAPSTRSGGATIEPQEYGDPDMQCHKFLTHAAGNPDAPYMQGPGEQYVNFSFQAPWTGIAYLRAVKIAVENAPVLHHWLLFKDNTKKADGAVTEVGLLGVHPDSTLLYGWAPGATPLYFDPDVGVELDSRVSYTLEAHMNNATGRSMGDHNGVELCVTTKKPEHLADITWVGTDTISGTSAQGTCRPVAREPIHFVAAQPHMHKKGRNMKVVVNRSGGRGETIHDHLFDFDDQRYYVLDTILMPGDSMTTTCEYSSPATFGPSTNQEMCYFFTIAWPAGAMNTGNGALLHGGNTCLQ